MVKRGSSSVLTSSAPSTTWASTPATSPSDSTVRSRRLGRRIQEPSTAAITARATTPVNSRFRNSISAWYSRSATKRSSEQVGQSSHPRPEPVRRTAAPVTTMVARAHSANRVSRAYVGGATHRWYGQILGAVGGGIRGENPFGCHRRASSS